MEAIVAVYSDWGIGSGGTQPVVLKADRAHFRQVTEGAAVIVGRRTLEDFPGGRPLKGRHNIVVTRQNIKIEGAQVVHSTGEALAAAAVHPRCLVIGGASVYKQFFPHIDCIYTKSTLFPTLTVSSPIWTAPPTGAVKNRAPGRRRTGCATASAPTGVSADEHCPGIIMSQYPGIVRAVPGHDLRPVLAHSHTMAEAGNGKQEAAVPIFKCESR